jgi:hypothetical protein
MQTDNAETPGNPDEPRRALAEEDRDLVDLQTWIDINERCMFAIDARLAALERFLAGFGFVIRPEHVEAAALPSTAVSASKKN